MNMNLLCLRWALSAWAFSLGSAVAAPAGLPAPVLQKIEQSLERVASQAEVKAAMQRAGAEPTWANAQAMNAFMQADAAQWKKVAAYAKIALD